LKDRNAKPAAFDPAAYEEFLRLLAEGIPRCAAAQQVGIDQETVRLAVIVNPELDEAMRKAEADADAKVARALFEAAISGNVQAAKLYLEARQSKRWRR